MTENDRHPNLVLLREWEETEGHSLQSDAHPEWGWAWPAPPKYQEYRVEGQMRTDVLTKVGRNSDDSCEIRLIQGWIEDGYSEYTVEHNYPIEVWIHEGRQAQKVWSKDYSWSEETALASFLTWVIPSE